MTIDTFTPMIMSIVRRLVYLAIFGRKDIFTFAPIAGSIFGNPDVEGMRALPPSFAKWLNRVERQLELERHFPAGLRLGSFACSPVIQLRDHFALHPSRRSSPWSEGALLKSYRDATGLQPPTDAPMLKDAGYSVKAYVADLVTTLRSDPTLAYLLLCREIRLAAEYVAIRDGDPHRIRTGIIDHFGQLKGNVVAHAAALFAHECLWAIGNTMRQYVERDQAGRSTFKPLNAVGLKIADIKQRADHRFTDECYGKHLQTLVCSVPGLSVVAKRFAEDRFLQLDAVHEVLGGREGIGGNTINPRIVHYYGVTRELLIAIGTIDILTVMIGLKKGKRAHGIHPNHQRPVLPARRLAQEVVEAMKGVGLPGTWDEVMRRAGPMRMTYLPPSHTQGGGGRFDPSLFLDPLKDWRMYERMARGDLDRPSTAMHGSYTANFRKVRDRLRRATPLFWQATKSAMQTASEPRRQAEIRRLCSKVVALLASSLTMFTSDPVFDPLLRSAMEKAGYKAKPNTTRQTKSSHGSCAEKPIEESDAVLSVKRPAERSLRQKPSDRKFRKYWGAKVPTVKRRKEKSDLPILIRL